MTDILEAPFEAWSAEARTVRRGEQARFYLIDPADPGAPGIALFALDQTDPREDRARVGLERVPREEYLRRRKEARAGEPRLPKAKCSWNADNKTMKVWVGNHEAAIKGFKAGKWLFDLGAHRWKKTGVDPIDVAQKLSKLGMRVEAEGFYYEPPTVDHRETI